MPQSVNAPYGLRSEYICWVGRLAPDDQGTHVSRGSRAPQGAAPFFSTFLDRQPERISYLGRRNGIMAKDKLNENHKKILANQKRILANQKDIKSNQRKLDRILE